MRAGKVAIWLCGVAVGVSLAASPLAAESYGAIGYSPATGAMGWGFDYPSSDSAARTALTRCADYARDCQIAVLFKDGCGVIAVGEEAHAAAASPSRSEAERLALLRCERRTSGCVVQRWICTTRSLY